METYTTISATQGQLSSITARNAYTQTLNYTGAQLASVMDPFGRALQFTYEGSLFQTP